MEINSFMKNYMKNRLHCKKGELFSRPQTGKDVTCTNLSLAVNNLIIPRQGEFG